MLTNLVHFYHVWCDGDWRSAAIPHMEALERFGFEGDIYIGLVGSAHNRLEAWEELSMLGGVKVCAEEDEGYEQVTLRAVRAHAIHHDGAVLYTHTKGSWDNSDHNRRWREHMTRLVVGRWRENLTWLETADALGCHWFCIGDDPETRVMVPYFMGNFWMARCDYLRTLPQLSANTRYHAEAWIGLNNPEIVDLSPGWPSEEIWNQIPTTIGVQ
jgi:hypothetical protein